jgi:hypothetical protein
MKRHRTPLILVFALLAAAAFGPAAAQARVSGGQVWAKPLTGFPMGYKAIAPAKGAVYVLGTRMVNGAQHIWFGKYDKDGKRVWSKTSRAGTAMCLTVTPKGNVIVCGSIDVSGHAADIVTVKYTAGGHHVWTSFYNGKASSNDVAYAVTTDPDGNVLVAGYTTTSAARGIDAMLLKLNGATGARIWRFAYDGMDSAGTDVAYDCAVNKSGTTFLAGSASNAGHTTAYALALKVAKSGKELWSCRLGVEGWAEGRKVAISQAGDCIVAGPTHGASNDIFAVKLGGMSALPKWGPVHYDFGGNETFHDMTLGRYGDIFCVGTRAGVGSSVGVIVAWRYNGTDYYHDTFPQAPGEASGFNAIVLDPNDNIYVGGWYEDPFDSVLLTKYAWTGSTFGHVWNQGIGSGGGGSASAADVTWIPYPGKGVYVCGLNTPSGVANAVVERVTP